MIDASRGGLWREAAAAAPAGYAAVFDANGVSTLRQGYRHLAPTGRLIVYGFHSMLPRGDTRGRPSWPRLVWAWLRTPRFSPLRLTGENRAVMGFNLSYLFERQDLLGQAMGELFAALSTGGLRAPGVTVYPFANIAQAHRDLEGGRTVGKLVLLVEQGPT